jgi:hypothetical protein
MSTYPLGLENLTVVPLVDLYTFKKPLDTEVVPIPTADPLSNIRLLPNDVVPVNFDT